MRAIAQLLISIGSALHLQFLIKIGQGLSQTALIGERATRAKQAVSKKDSDKED